MSVRSNGLYSHLAFNRIAIAQEAGHRRCDQLEPHVVEDRWNVMRFVTVLTFTCTKPSRIIEVPTSSATGKMCLARLIFDASGPKR